MSRLFLRLSTAALLLNTAACVSMTTPRFMTPAPDREWAPTLERAREAAAKGDATAADSMLARFATTYPGSKGAIEASYWRSVIQLGALPSQTSGATTLLNAYLANPVVERRMEAQALLVANSRVDSLTRAAARLTAKVQVSDGEVVSASNRAADAKADARAETRDQEVEIRKLRAELAESKEELDRIKKRLAEPPKKPPVR